MEGHRSAMAGFWDKVKEFFVGPASGSSAPGDARALKGRLRDEMMARAQAKASFEAQDLAAALAAPFADVARLADQLFHEGLLEPFAYKRWERPDAPVLFNPYTGQRPGEQAPAPQAPAAPGPQRAAAPTQRAAPSKPAAPPPPAQPPPPEDRTYAANPEVLGLSPEEHRKRALKIVPWRTAWIGRVDTIPPQSDERTALIDRGLVLRGLLTEAQLAEIHTVGDQWLEHHDALALAKAKAHKSADLALEALAEEKRRLKAERKAAAKAKADARRAAIAQRRDADIIFLGAGVSGGLGDRRSDVEKLGRQKLPVLSTPAEVAQALGVTVKRLRWLCFHADAASRVHYVAFDVPKRSGGVRRIAAPLPELAKAQRWVLQQVLARVPLHDAAHGFVPKRSTVTNAQLHVRQKVVVNVDLKDFFPTITFPRVKGVFEGLGYSPAVATVLALLCTEAPRRVATYDGQRLHVAVGPRALPQGACTSPALSNLVARRLDARLTGRARGLHFSYSRYADDLTFSSASVGRPAVARLLAMIRHVVQEEGFALNPKKGRVHVQGGQQLVTGLVVNAAPAVPRAERRRLRAILHQAKRTGVDAQSRGRHPNFGAYLQGMVAYVSMANPSHGEALGKQLAALTPKR